MTRLKNGKIVFIQIIINDSRGNIGSRSVYSYANGTVGAKTEFYDYVYGTDADAGWKKLLTSYNGETIDYDEIGNPIVYRDADLLWNGRQLRKYKADNFAETYFYNADGLRVRTKHYIKSGSSYEQTGETRYEYVGSSLVYQVTTNVAGAVEQELYFFYDASGKLSVIRQVTPTKDYHFYVTTNAQGDVLGIYSSTGTLLASYEYDAWGNCTVSYDNPTYKIGETNPIRYRGYYYDSETELYYLQSRYYDPEIGRFLNADGYITTGQGVLSYNMFAYCGNNPVMFSDPSGEIANWVVVTIVAAIILIATGADHYINHNHPEGVSLTPEYNKTITRDDYVVEQKTTYAKGAGFSSDDKGFEVFDLEVGLYDATATFNDGSEIGVAKVATAEASLNYGFEDGVSADLSGYAALFAITDDVTIDLGFATLELNAEMYFGSVSGGVSVDFAKWSGEVKSPTVGVGCSFGWDINWK